MNKTYKTQNIKNNVGNPDMKNRFQQSKLKFGRALETNQTITQTSNSKKPINKKIGSDYLIDLPKGGQDRVAGQRLNLIYDKDNPPTKID